MGRCLAFNFGPSELKQKLKHVRYFVYTPDYDSGGHSTDQYFYAVLDVTNADVDPIKKVLVEKLQLQGSKLRFSDGDGQRLFVILESNQPSGAITEIQIADVLLADQELVRMNLTAASITKYQDVVFGEDHLLAKELSKPFQQLSAFFVPPQDKWIVGKDVHEAIAKWKAIQK
jgi:hypothetical protein